MSNAVWNMSGSHLYLYEDVRLHVFSIESAQTRVVDTI